LEKKDKWPNCLGHLRPIYRCITNVNLPIEERVEYYRFLHTLLKLNKVVSDFVELDTNGIEAQFKVSPAILSEFEQYVKQNVQPIGRAQKLKPYISTSRGPNGQPMADSALQEAWAIRHSRYWNSFQNLAIRLNGEDFLSYLEHCSNKYENSPNFSANVAKATLLRKLVAIGDSGNKSRTVAMADFWTQNLLSVMEKDLIQILRNEFSESSDFFSHSSGFNKIREWSSNNEARREFLNSVDATAWTDNFPSELQKILLVRLYGKEAGNAWYNLVVKCPWNLSKSPNTVIYGKGQGMGVKGSFLIATITDHYFIEMVLHKHYHTLPFYRKVGDDLVIEDKDNILYDHYPKIGVPINESKSKRTTYFGRYVEYVSRNSWNELDSSVIPANLLAKARRSPLLLCPLLTAINQRINSSKQTMYIDTIIDNVKCSQNIRDGILRTSSLYDYLLNENILSNGSLLESYPDNTEKEIFLHIISEISDLFDKVLEKWRPAMRELLIEDHLRNQYDVSDWKMFIDRELIPSDLQSYCFLKFLSEQRDENMEVGERVAPYASNILLQELLVKEENKYSIPMNFRLRVSKFLFLLSNKLALNKVVGDLRSNIHESSPQCEEFMKCLLRIDRRLLQKSPIVSYDATGIQSLRLSAAVKHIISDEFTCL